MDNIVKPKIVIFGSGDMCKLLIEVVEKENKFEIIGLIDRFKENGQEVFGYKIIGDESNLAHLIKEYSIYGGIVAVGDNNLRYRIVQSIIKNYPNFKFVSSIHPMAAISRNVTIGEGTFIAAGVTVDVEASIGNHCFIAASSSFNHGCVMKDFSSLSAGVNVAGNSTLGFFSFLAVGSTVITHIDIGDNTVIGAGATVVKSIPSNTIAYGSPCKIIRSREIGDKYF